MSTQNFIYTGHSARVICGFGTTAQLPDEAIRLANDTRYGLGASLWTNDLNKVMRYVPKIQAGTVWVNSHNIPDQNMPFGGVKQSGIGREHGRGALDNYLETKSVCVAYR